MAYNAFYGGYNAQQAPSNIFTYVNGIEGAKAYILAPNTTAVLLDNEKPLMYMKSADMYGRASLKIYEYKEYIEPQAKPVDYITRQEFEEFKKRYEQSFITGNAVNEQRKPTADSNTNLAE